MQPSNGDRGVDPLRRFRAGWRSRARNVKDTWLPGTLPIESALEGTFREGVAFAAELLEEEGHRDLAGKLRARVQRSKGAGEGRATDPALETRAGQAPAGG
jgi:hypothetical protein